MGPPLTAPMPRGLVSSTGDTPTRQRTLGQTTTEPGPLEAQSQVGGNSATWLEGGSWFIRGEPPCPPWSPLVANPN